MELSTKYELVLNLKTAKALRLTIPQAVILHADLVACGWPRLAFTVCRRKRALSMSRFLLAAVLVLSPLDGLAGEKQIVDVRELAGRWRGWVTEAAGDERATMDVSADGSYKASIMSSTTVGTFYLQAGQLRYRSTRTTPLAMPSAPVVGTASVSEDKGQTILTLMPEDPSYQIGRAEYERVK